MPELLYIAVRFGYEQNHRRDRAGHLGISIRRIAMNIVSQYNRSFDFHLCILDFV